LVSGLCQSWKDLAKTKNEGDITMLWLMILLLWALHTALYGAAVAAPAARIIYLLLFLLGLLQLLISTIEAIEWTLGFFRESL
jgi:hypothetical protein